MIILNAIFTIMAGILMIPLISSIYADFMPIVEEYGTVPEVAMWKLMPLLILFSIFIASLASLVRAMRKKE